MSDDLADLLPLFLREAGERLERLSDLGAKAELDGESARLARRELHALKGATRMMRMPELSELCHHGEEVLDPLTAESGRRLTAVLDRMAGMVAELQGDLAEEQGRGSASVDVDGADERDDPRRAPSSPGSDGEELRIQSDVLASLADRTARSRVLAVTAGGLVDRIFNLARLAERGVNERQPQQILATVATSMRQLALDFEANQRHLLRLAERQLDELTRVQVQPLTPFLLSLARHARDLGRSLGKDVDVEVESGASHLDRSIIDALKEAILHLVRNAVDHGIEAAKARVESGKPAAGKLLLRATMETDRVRIEVADDGQGIDPVGVQEAAIRAGVITAEEAAGLDEQEIINLVCRPGLSTSSSATELSGRGVGLDAVEDAVRDVGGTLWITSEHGVGSSFQVEVPVSRRGERVLVVGMGQQQLALPASVALSFSRISPDACFSEGNRHHVTVGDGALLPVSVLSEHFGDAGNGGDATLIRGKFGGSWLSLVVDTVIGEEEVFLRPMPAAAKAPKIFDGMAVLRSGRPVPVLSPQQLASEETPSWDEHEDLTAARVLRVLLVDDSQVTREMIRRLLEDGGFSVAVAAGADEALATLAERAFDCLVTDIEMPGMDGLQLTRRLRETPQYAHLPVVVVSTRDRPEDRLAGLEAGADAYLTKQGLDARALVALVRRVGGHD